MKKMMMNDRLTAHLHVGEKRGFNLHVGVILRPLHGPRIECESMAHKTFSSNNVPLNHCASFIFNSLRRFLNHRLRLCRYSIEMEERIKIAYDLDGGWHKSWKSRVFGDRRSKNSCLNNEKACSKGLRRLEQLEQKRGVSEPERT